MRKIIISEHVSLDGFVGGPKGEMDWIKVDEEMFDLVGKFTDDADAALYGRVTWQMMDAYWPNAGTEAGASKHDKEHSAWYNKVQKIVLSRTMKGQNIPNTTIISHDVPREIKKIKEQKGKNILIFGSPRAAHSLMEHNLIDEFWLFINPVMLGKGIPMFAGNFGKTGLKLLGTEKFKCGVVGLHHRLE